MGKRQTSFLTKFQDAFRTRTAVVPVWSGGQVVSNTAALPIRDALRRSGPAKRAERFELGDIVAEIGRWRVVVEFESAEVPLSNLLKYWPYIRGELGTRPSHPLLICHFSDWWSYATRRDLWEWTLSRMKEDPQKVIDVQGRQFDHWSDGRTSIPLWSISFAFAVHANSRCRSPRFAPECGRRL